MKITKISILNFLGISSFKTNRLGKLNHITGGNGTGKSAVLKAITEVFKSSGVDPHIIKVGEEKAEILIELDDRIKIERQITHTANRPTVVVDGQPLNKPQQYLNDLVGPFIFNPVEFFLAKPKQRREILLSSIPFTIDHAKLNDSLGDMAVPIDLSKFDYSKHGLEVLEKIQKETYERRHEININLTRLKKAVEQDKIDIPENFNRKKFAEFDLNDKVNNLSEANVNIANHKSDIEKREQLRNRGSAILAEKMNLEHKIEQLNSEMEEIQALGKELSHTIESYQPPDVESIQSDINDYKQSQKLINKLEEIDRKESEVETQHVLHRTLDSLYKALTTDIPRKMLSQVQLPVDGIEIKGDNIFINGVSLEKLSTSEQIKFAVSVARSLAGDLKIICVDRFESLDKVTRKEFEKEAVSDDFEYFMTVVTEGELNLQTSTTDKAKSKTNVGF